MRGLTWRSIKASNDGRPPGRRAFAAGILLALALAASGCTENSQSTTRSTGGPAGTTLHLSLRDQVGVKLGDDELFGSSSSGFDGLDGDLIAAGSGQWRGAVTGITERTAQVTVLGSKCDTSVRGTQQLEVVATRGSYGEGRDLRLVLTPLGPPQYTTFPTCNQPEVMEKASNGIEWLWFYLDTYKGSAIEVKLPAAPGGTWKWEFAPNPNPGYYGGCGGFDLLMCTHQTTLTVEYR